MSAIGSTRVCEQCGAEFTVKHKSQSMCSRSCALVASKKRWNWTYPSKPKPFDEKDQRNINR